jgi:hypothetical protein
MSTEKLLELYGPRPEKTESVTSWGQESEGDRGCRFVKDAKNQD